MTALAISSGFVIETTKSYNPPTPPGQVLQIDGAQGKVSIHVQKRGNGPLTVLLDGGVGETSFDWNKVSKSIESFATVVSIDRPGTGFSSPGDLPRTSSQVST
jgi:pimeloyl-ACP methyl ester carboxylesterase